MNKNEIVEMRLSALREKVSKCMSEKRFLHTLGVEEMAARLADIYSPNDREMLCAAALLHDITKEYMVAEHMEILNKAGVSLDFDPNLSPKVLHAMTAALMIPERFPEFDSDDLISAVRWHTTGHADMTLAERLLYLADYIDMTRKFPDCVRLRNYFFDKDFSTMSKDEKMLHLMDTLRLSFDMTLRGLLDDRAVISPDTIKAYNDCAQYIKKANI